MTDYNFGNNDEYTMDMGGDGLDFQDFSQHNTQPHNSEEDSAYLQKESESGECIKVSVYKIKKNFYYGCKKGYYTIRHFKSK